MEHNVRIGIAGATGAVGRELLNVLDGSPWRPKHVVAMARVSTTTSFVSYGDQQLPVEDLAAEDLSALDLLFVALPREEAGELVDRAAQAGVTVVDLSGSQLEQPQVPLVVPWLHHDLLDEARERDVVAIPSAAAILLATVLSPLVQEGWKEGIEAHVLLPASWWGQAGIDELSHQVSAMFNAVAPPRKVFPAGLAFDVLPLVGTPGVTGWTGEELRVVAELGRMLGVLTSVTLTAVPTFTGMSATLRLDVPDDVVADAVGRALVQAGLSVADHGDLRRMPRTRRVDGESLPQVARVRRAMGGAVHLQAAVDNLRTVAVAAVSTASSLLQATGRLGDA